MDAVSAIGVAAAVLQFVDLGTRIVKRLKDYSSTASEVPKSLQHISYQLPLLVNALDRLKTGVQVERLDLSTKCILKGVVDGCKQQVDKLDGIIEKVLNIPGDSRRLKIQKALVSLRNDTKVLEIEKCLQIYISVLTLHQVIEGTATSPHANEEDCYFEVHIKQASPFVQRVHWMRKLETYLDPAATSQILSPLVVYLVGPEAAGKTQLAVEYCHRARDIGQFPTILWLNGSTPQHLVRSLETTSDIVRRSKDGLKDEHEKTEFVKSFLCNRWHPWLLVIDNYDPSQLKDLMDYLPSRSCGAILLITRHESFLPASANVMCLPMYRAPEEQAFLGAELFRNIKDENVEAVGRLLTSGADPDFRDDYYDLPCLHFASQRGLKPIVELLLKGGAQPRARSSSERRNDGRSESSVDGSGTALYEAASAGQTMVVNLLLDWEDTNRLSPQAPRNSAVLMVAAQQGHEEIVCKLMEHSSEHIDGSNEQKENALGLAARNGHADIVKLLLDHGANAEAEYEYTLPIIWALVKGHLGVVRILAAHGKFDVNGVYHDLYGIKHTPLYQCFPIFGTVSIEMLQYLLDLGARPRSSAEGEYPLQRAVSNESEQAVSLLLEHGADPNLSNTSDVLPLHEAARLGSTTMVRVLLVHGADPNRLGRDLEEKTEIYPLVAATKGGFETMVTILLEHGADPNLSNTSDPPPLHEAARLGSTTMVRVLLEHGADPNALGKQGSRVKRGYDYDAKRETCPLFEAASRGFTSVVSVPLKHGADPYPTYGSTSPISKAAQLGHEGIVQLVLHAKARDSKIQDEQRQSALRMASANGHRKVVRLLLEAGADINASNWEKRTALLLAAENGQISIARLLLNRGAREDISDNKGRSPIFAATEKGLDLMVQAILLSTGKPDVQNGDGNTPLCVSAARGHEKVVEVLLEFGADRTLSNNLEETPLDLALEHGHRSIIKLLQQPVVQR